MVDQDGWVTVVEARQRLGFGPAPFATCVQRGLLTVVKRGETDCVALAELAHFQKAYVLRGVVLRQLGVTNLRTWVKHGFLHPIRIAQSLYFAREEVDQLKKFREEYMSMSAAARIFHFDHEIMRHAAEKGLIVDRRIGGIRYVRRTDAAKFGGYRSGVVAERLGVTWNGLMYLVRNGYLAHSVTPRGQRRFSDEALKLFLEMYGKSDVYKNLKKST